MEPQFYALLGKREFLSGHYALQGQDGPGRGGLSIAEHLPQVVLQGVVGGGLAAKIADFLVAESLKSGPQRFLLLLTLHRCQVEVEEACDAAVEAGRGEGGWLLWVQARNRETFAGPLGAHAIAELVLNALFTLMHLVSGYAHAIKPHESLEE